MAINLKTEYSPLLDKRFTQKSLTEQWCSHDYSWEGDETIKVWTLGQVVLNDYWTPASAFTANRFTGGSAPTELQDEINTYTLRNRKSFAATIDMTVNQDQANIKKANSVLKQVWDEQIVPLIDQDRLNSWAAGAGTAVINSTALTYQTILRQILVGSSVLNNNLVAREGRVCFVTETMAVECKLVEQLAHNDAFTTKALVNGEVARLNGMPIVAVPDAWMPAGVEFMIKYKKASADPRKLKLLRSNNNVPGLAGTLIEGLVRFDSFVLAQKAMGIYVYGASGIQAAPSAATQSSGTLTITEVSSPDHTFYTLDGSNPKTSSTAAEYDSSSKPTGVAAGTVVKTYSTKAGVLPSGIASFVLA